MIYLLYGSDFDASRGKLNEIIAEYRKKSGDGLNFYAFDAEEDELGKIREALGTNSLFSNKKIVTIKCPSRSANKEALLDAFRNLKESLETIVFLRERELGTKELAELRPYCNKVQEFRSENKFIKPAATIFALGDTFFISPREGLRTLLGLLHDGHDDFTLFSYLANHVRTLLTVKHYGDAGKNVPSSRGIHPYVMKKAAALARGLSQEKLAISMRQFFDEDRKIKTGLSKPRDSLFSLLTDKSRQPRL